jgi:hypothetical protein
MRDGFSCLLADSVQACKELLRQFNAVHWRVPPFESVLWLEFLNERTCGVKVRQAPSTLYEAGLPQRGGRTRVLRTCKCIVPERYVFTSIRVMDSRRVDSSRNPGQESELSHSKVKRR